jgi:hypothetical protein
MHAARPPRRSFAADVPQVCVVEYVEKAKIGVVVNSLTAPFPPDLFEQLVACKTALAGVANHAVFDVASFCQRQVRSAKTGLAVDAAEVDVATHADETRRMSTRVSLSTSMPWADIVTHLHDVNADCVSSRHGSFSGAHAMPDGAEGGHQGRLWRSISGAGVRATYP